MYYREYDYLIGEIKYHLGNVYMFSDEDSDQPSTLLSKIENLKKNSNLLFLHEIEDLEMGTCPICYEPINTVSHDGKELKPRPNVTTTPCGHSFCFTCLSKHLENKNKCPICRKKLLKRPNLKPVSVYEGCYIINKKIDEHLVNEIDKLIMSSADLRDSSILLGSIKHCMYEMMQSFRCLQLVESDDETEL
jgi:hypothetical protein